MDPVATAAIRDVEGAAFLPHWRNVAAMLSAHLKIMWPSETATKTHEVFWAASKEASAAHIAIHSVANLWAEPGDEKKVAEAAKALWLSIKKHLATPEARMKVLGKTWVDFLSKGD